MNDVTHINGSILCKRIKREFADFELIVFLKSALNVCYNSCLSKMSHIFAAYLLSDCPLDNVPL